MTTYTLGLPAQLRDRLQRLLPRYTGYPAVVRVIPLNAKHKRCAAYEADHYQVQAYTYTYNRDHLNDLEAALKAEPGVYATTQVHTLRDATGTLVNVFTNPDWPPPLGIARRDRNSLRPQVMALIKDPEEAARA